jgi:DNA repair protein RecO (recombination protein O)
MPEHRDRAVVLRVRPYREYDVLVTLFGEQLGKVAAVARGARRSSSQLAAGTQPLALSQVRLFEGRSTLWTLSGAELEALWSRLRGDFERTARAAMLADTVDELSTDRDPAPETFRVLTAALSALDAGEAARVVYLAGLWKLFRPAGLQPDVSVCHGCGVALPSEGEASWRQGEGPVCRDCRRQDDQRLPPGALTLLRHWARLEPDRLGQGRGAPGLLGFLDRLTRDHVLYHTGRMPRAFRFWQQVEGMLEEGPSS